MNEKRGFDVVVVGGGVIGLACAWRLARDGAEVAVLERGQPGGGASRVAAGMLAPVGELTFGEPELLELTLAAARLYPEFVAELEAETGRSTGYERLGALHVALDRDEAAQLRRVHDLQRSLDLEAEWLSTRQCRGLEPGLAPSFHGGVLAAGEAAVDPRALTEVLLGACRDEGVEVHAATEVVDGIFEGEQLVGVRAKGQSDVQSTFDRPLDVRAGTVVLAIGAWSGRADWLPGHARPAVRPVKGQVVELRSRSGEPPARH
ncbi:MAG TPA: FAD-dependent oxidoreductase, partial [Solirubrobacterales bacterium]|nr:FAD-dependent oxidoreductase [Solirubrobacterales bacterium]